MSVYRPDAPAMLYSFQAAATYEGTSMEKPTGQIWLPVVGFEGFYDVSDLGLVWTYRRKGTKGGLLKTLLDNRNYQQINVCRDGVKIHTHVHVLVATAFHGPCPAGMECRHLDGNRSNNVASNLAWGTASENNLDRVRHGTFTNRNIGKTHCDHGHEFTPENTKMSVRNGTDRRTCWACTQRRNKEQAARRKAARHARRV